MPISVLPEAAVVATSARSRKGALNRKAFIACLIVMASLVTPSLAQCDVPTPRRQPSELHRAAPGRDEATAGARAARTSLFSVNWSQKKVMSAVREAYANSTVVRVQGDRVLPEGKPGDEVIRMWFHKKEKLIETAYPVK